MSRGLRIAITVAALAATLAVISQNMSWPEVRARLTGLDMTMLLLLFGLAVVTRLPQTETLRRALASSGVRLGFMDCFWGIALKAMFNQLFSGVGLVAQGAQLKWVHAVDIKQFARATWMSLLALLLTVACSGAAVSVWFWVRSDMNSVVPVLPWVGLLLLAALAVRMPASLLRLPFVRSRLGSDGLPYQGAAAMLALVPLQFGVLLLRLARLLLVLSVVAPDMQLLSILFAFLLGEIAIVFPITPGGIGIRELLLGMGGIGVAAEHLVLAGLVDRIVATAATLALGGMALIRSGNTDTIKP